MQVPDSSNRPSSTSNRLQPPHREDLPDYSSLDDNPQLASVAVLQTALPVTADALEAHHGDWGPRAMPEAATPQENYVLLLASLIYPRCLELSDLLGAYRAAIANCAEPSDDDPF